jgi:LuxR family maltose regulon positive regulatory protein
MPPSTTDPASPLRAVELPAFALAKIQPPRPRAGLVERPQLERVLDAAWRQHRVTLLIAPAGYGKTAALTQLIRRLPAGCALAWITADEDDELQRFLACLVTALEPYDLPWRVAPEALGTLAQTSHGPRDVAVEILNALAAAEVERGLIVVDDAHQIGDPQVFDLLQAVIDRLPEPWGVVIASRVEPPLSLARWRAAGELAEFRQVDLRFNAAELDALISTSGAALTPTASRELLQRTDGWAAALRLSLTMRAGDAPHGAGAPNQRHLFDYLASEVLADMPAGLRAFLLRCSVLPELTVSRCARLCGHAEAVRWLDEIERRGLFVTALDAHELTLRLHDLFRDFLEDRLQREHPDELPALLRAAAQDEPDLARAMGWLARAGAWDEAALALAQRGPVLLGAGGRAVLEKALALFPETQLAGRADLQVLRGLIAFTRYDWDQLLLAMESAARGFAAAGREQEAALARAYACAGLHHTGRRREATEELARLRELPLADPVRAVACYISAWDEFACERGEDVAPLLARMLDALTAVGDPALWHQCANLGLFAGLANTTPLLERFATDVMRLSSDTPTQLRAGAMHVRCSLALLAGRLDDAWEWLQRADEDCRWLGTPRLLTTDNAFLHVLVHALRGEAQACHAHARAAIDDLSQHGAPSHRNVHMADLLIAHARGCWLLGDAAGLAECHRLLQRAANPIEWSTSPRCRALAAALVALSEQRWDDARELLEPLASSEERHMFFPAAQARVLLADVLLRQGRPQAAAATLAPWLTRALQNGEVGGALLAGARVLGRLAAADWNGAIAAPELALLRTLPARMPGAGGGGDASPLRFERLSEREREVLARLAAGDSNKLIARAFDLSPHTVKRHVANILDKLGVATRGQAAACWREDTSR